MLVMLFLSTFLILSAVSPRISAAPDAYIDGSIKSGWATYYTEWKYALGSCGVVPKSDNLVCALSSKYMKLPPGVSNPNNHPLCGPKYCILTLGPRGAAVVKVSDTCGACIQAPGDNVDLADSLYPLVADPLKGKVPIKWKFVDCTKYRPGKFTGNIHAEFPGQSVVDKRSLPEDEPSDKKTTPASKKSPKISKRNPRKKVVTVVPPAANPTSDTQPENTDKSSEKQPENVL